MTENQFELKQIEKAERKVLIKTQLLQLKSIEMDNGIASKDDYNRVLNDLKKAKRALAMALKERKKGQARRKAYRLRKQQKAEHANWAWNPGNTK